MNNTQLYDITYFRNSAELMVKKQAIISLKQLKRLKKIPWITIDSCKKVDDHIEEMADILSI